MLLFNIWITKPFRNTFRKQYLCVLRTSFTSPAARMKDRFFFHFNLIIKISNLFFTFFSKRSKSTWNMACKVWQTEINHAGCHATREISLRQITCGLIKRKGKRNLIRLYGMITDEQDYSAFPFLLKIFTAAASWNTHADCRQIWEPTHQSFRAVLLFWREWQAV